MEKRKIHKKINFTKTDEGGEQLLDRNIRIGINILYTYMTIVYIHD